MSVFPDYEGGSILNLMSSIETVLGDTSDQPGLRQPLPDGTGRKILMITLDGLGDGFLQSWGKDSFLLEHWRERLTSVFLSTTACAMTTYYTALPPLAHALTGWFVYLREIGVITQILPMVPRVPAVNLTGYGVQAEDVLDFSSVFSRLHCPSMGIYPRHLVGSAFSSYATRGSVSRGFGTLGEFERNIIQAVNEVPSPGYVFAYWSAFDKITHRYGVSHWRTVQHFRRLDEALRRVYEALKGTGTLMLVSADHGLIDVPPENTHWLADAPELEATLSLPLSGEPRMPYCYVKPGREDEFLDEVDKLFGEHVQVFDRERILREGWFGRGVMNPQLPDRIGDYVLKFDDARVLRDLLPGERRHDFVAYHGSDSEDEMYVPLIVVEC